ncbi:hypothetical protein B0T10DRAFT_486822 [Thelonectria olida]|uniref:Uncharacterized protein n=1 Tax=Thelonectria olida TaxID=1576542 RepID=A0A9P8W472_9HYPO|nr:hypothetical protein B0T10DRAFT_486822 [Thelonectria olida]
MKSPWLSTLLSGAVLAQATHAQVFVPESYAIGFDLGQSYGTSAVHFKNGTTVNLAKVAGDAQYMSMMQRLTDLNYRPYKDVKRGDKLAEYWRNLKRSCGYATTEDAAILEQMVSQLKKESEAAFNKTIVRASFTAPLIKSWHDRDWWDNDLTDALLRAGLEPSLSAALKDQMYLTESRATLLDAEIETCQLPGRFKFDGKGRPILYIK